MQDTNTSKAEISALIQRWAFCRDTGRWEELAATFAPHGVIQVSWFNGRHADFVEASRARHGRSFNQHQMLTTLAEVQGSRAWAESMVQMIGYGRMDGVEVRWQCHFRMIDLLARDADRWTIHSRTAVYDLDHLTADSSTDLVLDQEVLRAIPRAYRYLGYRLRLAGLAVPDDLPTAHSEAEASLRQSAREWLLAKGPPD